VEWRSGSDDGVEKKEMIVCAIVNVKNRTFAMERRGHDGTVSTESLGLTSTAAVKILGGGFPSSSSKKL